MPLTPAQRPAVLVLFVLGLMSGAVALAYEVLWTRELLNLLGSTTRASALVLSGFMGGLAVGAYVAGRLTTRIGQPLLIFACAEAALGGFGFVFPSVLRFIAANFHGDVLLDVGLLAILVVPATLMGAALPALAAALQQRSAVRAGNIALLYGFNTLGGAAAAFGTGLVALPNLGLAASGRWVASSGLLLAALGMALSRQAKTLPSPGAENVRAAISDTPLDRIACAAVLAALLLSGVAALGYQVLWTRILVLVVGSSSTAFALMLGLYLLGLALGGFVMSRLSGWENRPGRTFWALQLSVGVTALLGAAVFGRLPSIALFGFAQLGTAPRGILVVNLLLIAAIILPPTLFIGASFPVAARLMVGERPHRGREVGLVLAVTTAGNMIGVLFTAFVAIPTIGLQQSVAVMAGLNALAAVVIWLTARDRAVKLLYATPAAALAVALAGIMLPRWDIAVMSSGVFRQAPVYLALLGSASRLEQAFSAYETRYYREGSEAVVAVFDRPTLQGAPHRVLTIDGKVDASTGADMATQVLSGHLPFLFHPRARNALVIGLASGVTVGALARHPLDRIDVVEIEPAVVEASRVFDPVSNAPLDDPRVHVTVADGRRYLSRTRTTYDIVVSEPSNPWLSMSSRLFTQEFFEIVRKRLTPGGVLVQWIPLYGLNYFQFKTLLRTILGVFPDVAFFRVAEGDIVALAGIQRLKLDPAALSRLFGGETGRQLRSIGVVERADLLARWTVDGDGIRKSVKDGPLNTDDNALLEYGSPWYLLSDTKPANNAFLAQASRDSGVPERIAKSLLSVNREPSELDALAARYLASGRLEMLRGLAKSLVQHGDERHANLYRGDFLAAEGRWSEAEALWALYDGPEFLRRRARASFKAESMAASARLFARVPESLRSPRDEIAYALALNETGQREEALRLLAVREFQPNTVPAVLARFVSFALLSDMGAADRSRAELRRLEQSLDELRRCLETERCQGAVDQLLRWSRGGHLGVRPLYSETLKEAVFLRITRPLPHYFDGVRSLWLGDRRRAARSFRTYLKLLPEPDAGSKALGFLAADD
jgi:spermidine synthase